MGITPPEPDITIRIGMRFNGSVVYGWKKDGNYLYIGRTKIGSNRFSSHHIINKKNGWKPEDEIDLWFNQGEELETALIITHKPKFNKNYPLGFYNEKLESILRNR
jgi:hypothetical protein